MDFLRDFRLAARNARHTPGFSVAVVATLAFGIGAATAAFSSLGLLLLVIRRGMTLAAAGLTLGLLGAAALAASGVLDSLLFGPKAGDAWMKPRAAKLTPILAERVY